MATNDSFPIDPRAAADRPDRDAHGHFAAGNRIGKRPKLRAGPLGAVRLRGKQADALYAAFMRWAARYATRRRAELRAMFGEELSTAVCMLVESAGRQLGDAQYLRARAAERGEHGLLRRAAALEREARVAEQAAIELARQEATQRIRAFGRLLPQAMNRPLYNAGTRLVRTDPEDNAL